MGENDFKSREDLGTPTANFVRDLHGRYPGHGHLNAIAVAVDAAPAVGRAADRAVKEGAATQHAAQQQVKAAIERSLEKLAKEDEKTSEQFVNRPALLDAEAVDATRDKTPAGVARRAELRARLRERPHEDRLYALMTAAGEGRGEVLHAILEDPDPFESNMGLAPESVLQARDLVAEKVRPEESRLLRDGANLRQQVSEFARRRLEELAASWGIDFTKANEDALRARLQADARRRRGHGF